MVLLCIELVSSSTTFAALYLSLICVQAWYLRAVAYFFPGERGGHKAINDLHSAVHVAAFWRDRQNTNTSFSNSS